MSAIDSLTIREVPEQERAGYDVILEDSFSGVYLRHARKTISEVQVVRAAFVGEEPVGLSMLKLLHEGAGYVYYIAVREAQRGKGVGSRLLRDGLDRLSSMGAKDVYASVGEHNVESNASFRGNGFRKTDYGEVSRKYGVFKAILMYREMFVVPGEILLVHDSAALS